MKNGQSEMEWNEDGKDKLELEWDTRHHSRNSIDVWLVILLPLFQLIVDQKLVQT